jgi:hypothetical protein
MLVIAVGTIVTLLMPFSATLMQSVSAFRGFASNATTWPPGAHGACEDERHVSDMSAAIVGDRPRSSVSLDGVHDVRLVAPQYE